MKIQIPHINYTVTIKDINKTNKINIFKNKPTGLAEQVDKNNAIIYLPKKISHYHHGIVGHEIIHVLQFIAEDRNMNFILEQEHFAYIFMYLFGEICGYGYNK